MKKTSFFTLFVFLLCCKVFAQNEKYVQAMTATLKDMNAIDRSKPGTAALQEIANRFERIATAEQKEWLPRYHAAYCYVQMSLMGGTVLEKDQYLDKAEAFLKQAETILGKTSDETAVLRANLSQMRLAADGMNRWQSEGPKFAQFIEEAKKLNPENPRIYYLEGSGLFFTPEQFGGGKKIAKPVLEKALEKFSTFKPESAIHPNWGKMETEWMLSQGNQ
ncbi:hypothetical protein [Dyadobacter psychrotolerans]|uniref:Tetratricopeptide repeat protein n=1 Tax=Dyadobacter psychrotolerans TaxID=2541721 RepID=A0A4R5DLH9_9BACT|nr:hypothetical protein [Dyadobacter psychrotolerans]TDE11725.1 hypothetical protein E0F88_25210 [Dyadobacter psychrotolerans]